MLFTVENVRLSPKSPDPAPPLTRDQSVGQVRPQMGEHRGDELRRVGIRTPTLRSHDLASLCRRFSLAPGMSPYAGCRPLSRAILTRRAIHSLTSDASQPTARGPRGTGLDEYSVVSL